MTNKARPLQPPAVHFCMQKETTPDFMLSLLTFTKFILCPTSVKAEDANEELFKESDSGSFLYPSTCNCCHPI